MFFFFFFSLLFPFKIISLIEMSQLIGGAKRGTSHIYLKRKFGSPVLETRYTVYSLGANHPVRLYSLSALL